MLMRIEPSENVPLLVDEGTGTIRIPGTRLRLENVMDMHHRGFSAEEMAWELSTLTVDAAQRIMEWYPTRKREVDDYVDYTVEGAESVRSRLEPLYQRRTQELLENKGVAAPH